MVFFFGWLFPFYHIIVMHYITLHLGLVLITNLEIPFSLDPTIKGKVRHKCQSLFTPYGTSVPTISTFDARL